MLLLLFQVNCGVKIWEQKERKREIFRLAVVAEPVIWTTTTKRQKWRHNRINIFDILLLLFEELEQTRIYIFYLFKNNKIKIEKNWNIETRRLKENKTNLFKL